METKMIHGDCLEVLKTFAENSVDSVVTDPPYGIRMMGAKWDCSVPSVEIWKECLRVLKPGGHVLAFASTRTQHRMAVNIEDAGFEIRDMIAWAYSGMPKSLNLKGDMKGFGTALKPAMEPVTLARKPLAGTVARNVSEFGTGALNIDGCRVKDGSETGGERPVYIPNRKNEVYRRGSGGGDWANTNGRWPANVIHDGSGEIAELFGEAVRFFYCPKASRADRDEGLDALPLMPYASKQQNSAGRMENGVVTNERPWQTLGRNTHISVKPTNLMRYLCRLVTPPGGTVLDPFAGSGSTGKAAVLEGFGFVGIELDEDSHRIAAARISHALAHRAALSQEEIL